jgi:ribosome-dependent ATPase
MKYHDGKEVSLGDRVELGVDRDGVVVCVLDTGEYSATCPAAEWSHLKNGVIIDFPKYGKIHYKDAVEPDVHLIARGSGT